VVSVADETIIKPIDIGKVLARRVVHDGIRPAKSAEDMSPDSMQHLIDAMGDCAISNIDKILAEIHTKRAASRPETSEKTQASYQSYLSQEEENRFDLASINQVAVHVKIALDSRWQEGRDSINLHAVEGCDNVNKILPHFTTNPAGKAPQR
jgi:hypothetical protein